MAKLIGGSYGPSIPVALTGGYRPNKKDYTSEEDFIAESIKYYISTVSGDISVVHRQHKAAMDMYTKNVSVLPSTGQSPDSSGITPPPANSHVVNKIFTMIRRLVGQRATSKVIASANVLNASAEHRALTYQAEVGYDAYVANSFPSLYNDFVNGMFPKYDSKEGDDLITFAEKSYRDKYAKAIERVIKAWMESSEFEDWYIQTYQNFLITETAIAMPVVDEETMELHLPLIRSIDAIWDMGVRSDKFTGQQFIFTYEYLSYSDALTRYPDIPEENFERLLNSTQFFGGFPVVRTHNNRNSVLVMYCRFIYNEPKTVEVNETMKEVDLSETGEIQIKPKRKQRIANYQEVYEGTIVGGIYLVNSGRLKYQVRSVDKPAKANLGARVLRLDQSMSPTSEPLVLRVKYYQDMITLSMQKIASIVANMRGPIREIDIAKVDMESYPDGGNQDKVVQVLNDMFRNRFVIKNSRDLATLGEGGTGKVVDVVNDGTEVAEVANLVQLIQMYYQELKEMLSWNEAMQGNISQYASGTNLAQVQQNVSLSMSYREESFNKFVSSVLSDVANIIKLIIHNGYKGRSGMPFMPTIPIKIGELSYDILANEEFATQDYGITLDVKRSQEQIQNELRTATQIGLQQGSLSIRDYLMLNKESDPIEAIDQYLIYTAKQEMQKAEEARAMQEQQMAMQQQQIAAQQQNEMMKNETALQKQREADAASLERTVIQGATK